MGSLTLTIEIIGCLLMGAFGLSIATNTMRARKDYHFELKPNCLLTRFPIVFVTGQSSLFYYRNYWNAFPALLAEHGYEVFTLQLPWKGPLRAQKMKEFLREQEGGQKCFHFVMDAATERELATLVGQSPSGLSITVPNAHASAFGTDSAEKSASTNPLVRFSFALHRKLRSLPNESSVTHLGAAFPAGKEMLLERMQYLGEQDFLR